MTSPRKTFEAVLRGQKTIAFQALQQLLIRLGFRLDRVNGSHHIFIHPRVPRPINIQSVGKDAKPYQIRQLRDMIEEFDLKLED